MLVAAAVYVVEARQAVASTLTAAGTALIAFGALLPYIEGPFAFGPFRGTKVAVPPTPRKGKPPTTVPKVEVQTTVAPQTITTSSQEESDA